MLTGQHRPPSARRVGAVSRAGAILDLFTPERPEWGLAEAARQLEVSKGGLHGHFASLIEIGLLRRTDDGRYRLGWRWVTTGRELLASERHQAATLGLMKAFSSRWGDTMRICVLDRGDVISLHRSVGKHRVLVPDSVRTYTSAAGKTLIAEMPAATLEDNLARGTATATHISPARLQRELEQVRRHGLATDLGETEAGLSCIAAPLRGGGGEVVAALSISTSAARFERQEGIYARIVTAAATRISEELSAATQGRRAVRESRRITTAAPVVNAT